MKRPLCLHFAGPDYINNQFFYSGKPFPARYSPSGLPAIRPAKEPKVIINAVWPCLEVQNSGPTR
jgi:hypothetical protein